MPFTDRHHNAVENFPGMALLTFTGRVNCVMSFSSDSYYFEVRLRKTVSLTDWHCEIPSKKQVICSISVCKESQNLFTQKISCGLFTFSPFWQSVESGTNISSIVAKRQHSVFTRALMATDSYSQLSKMISQVCSSIGNLPRCMSQASFNVSLWRKQITDVTIYDVTLPSVWLRR